MLGSNPRAEAEGSSKFQNCRGQQRNLTEGEIHKDWHLSCRRSATTVMKDRCTGAEALRSGKPRASVTQLWLRRHADPGTWRGASPHSRDTLDLSHGPQFLWSEFPFFLYFFYQILVDSFKSRKLMCGQGWWEGRGRCSGKRMRRSHVSLCRADSA